MPLCQGAGEGLRARYPNGVCGGRPAGPGNGPLRPIGADGSLRPLLPAAFTTGGLGKGRRREGERGAEGREGVEKGGGEGRGEAGGGRVSTVGLCCPGEMHRAGWGGAEAGPQTPGAPHHPHSHSGSPQSHACPLLEQLLAPGTHLTTTRRAGVPAEAQTRQAKDRGHMLLGEAPGATCRGSDRET